MTLLTRSGFKPYVTANLRVKDGEESQWWNIVALAESAQAQLNGKKRVSLGVVADYVTALHQPKHQKAAMPSRAPKGRQFQSLTMQFPCEARNE